MSDLDKFRRDNIEEAALHSPSDTNEWIAHDECCRRVCKTYAPELLKENDALAAVLVGIEAWARSEPEGRKIDCVCLYPVEVIAKLAALKREHGIGGAK